MKSGWCTARLSSVEKWKFSLEFIGGVFVIVPGRPHAGLDLLLTEVRSADPASPYVATQRSTADFIVHMFASSESAIHILNELLQYEHMEAGNGIYHPFCYGKSSEAVCWNLD